MKRWSAKQRLEEIENRLEEIDAWSDLQPSMEEEMDEIFQIIKYWKRHMKKIDKNNNES